MRAVWIGLVGAVLASGGAQAKDCPLDGLSLAATARAPDASKYLIGAKFRVVRQASSFKTQFNPAKGRVATFGTITIEVAGDKGRFVIGQDYEPNAMPWVSATSWASDDPKATANWKQRNRAQEKKLFDSDASFDIYGGPLAGLTLNPTNCR